MTALRTRRVVRLLSLALLAALVAGCGTSRREPVYRNEKEGLQFTPPAGWSDRGTNDKAAARGAAERVLVQYKRLTAGRPAWLRLGTADVPATPDLATYPPTHPPAQ